MTHYTPTENTTRELFNRRLKDSEPARQFIAKYLRSLGHCLTVKPLQLETSDEGDIIYHAPTGDKIIEVKHRPRLFFIGPECFLMKGWDDVMICRKGQHDAYIVPPWKYFIVNNCMSHAAVIDVESTKKHWTHRKVEDPEEGRSGCIAYHVDVWQAKWIELRMGRKNDV